MSIIIDRYDTGSTLYSTCREFEHINVPLEWAHFSPTHRPIDLGRIVHQEILDRNLNFPNSLDGIHKTAPNILVKGIDQDYSLPDFYLPLLPIIRIACQWEAKLNPKVDNYNAYLQYEQVYLQKNDETRTGKWHIDGFNPRSVIENQPGTHSFIITNLFPTLYIDEEVNLDDFDLESDHFTYKGNPSQVGEIKSYHLNFFNQFVLHKSQSITHAGFRSFFRLMFVPSFIGERIVPLHEDTNYYSTPS